MRFIETGEAFDCRIRGFEPVQLAEEYQRNNFKIDLATITIANSMLLLGLLPPERISTTAIIPAIAGILALMFYGARNNFLESAARRNGVSLQLPGFTQQVLNILTAPLFRDPT